MAKRSKRTAKTAPLRAKPARKTKNTARPRTRPSKPWKEGDVRFTHPDRVYWVDVGVTKQDLADYYRSVWDVMAPHVIGRPLALVRCPEGTKGECFFQKHASAGLTERDLRVVTDTKRRQVIAIESLDGLLSLVQAGVLEVHVRGSTIDHLELCERIVFDLDPGEGVAWKGIVQAARDVHDRLAAIKLKSFVKLSGGKGLHVVVPIVGTDWDTTKTFVQAFAQAMAADDPDRYVAKMTKSLRGGKIFIDYLRNSLEQTSVAAYSTRARAGRTGLGAGDVAGTRPHHRRQSIHGAESRQAPRRPQAGPVGGHRAREAEAAGCGRTSETFVGWVERQRNPSRRCRARKPRWVSLTLNPSYGRRNASHVLAAVDVDLRAVHVGRRLGAQHVDDLGDLVGGAEPVHRNLLATIFSVPGDRIAVSISPGAIALTRMPSGPKSAAISRVSDASAAFEVA